MPNQNDRKPSGSKPPPKGGRKRSQDQQGGRKRSQDQQSGRKGSQDQQSSQQKRSRHSGRVVVEGHRQSLVAEESTPDVLLSHYRPTDTNKHHVKVGLTVGKGTSTILSQLAAHNEKARAKRALAAQAGETPEVGVGDNPLVDKNKTQITKPKEGTGSQAVDEAPHVKVEPRCQHEIAVLPQPVAKDDRAGISGQPKEEKLIRQSLPNISPTPTLPDATPDIQADAPPEPSMQPDASSQPMPLQDIGHQSIVAAQATDQDPGRPLRRSGVESQSFHDFPISQNIDQSRSETMTAAETGEGSTSGFETDASGPLELTLPSVASVEQEPFVNTHGGSSSITSTSTQTRNLPDHVVVVENPRQPVIEENEMPSVHTTRYHPSGTNKDRVKVDIEVAGPAQKTPLVSILKKLPSTKENDSSFSSQEVENPAPPPSGDREDSQSQPNDSTIPLDRDYRLEAVAQSGDEMYPHQSGILAPPPPGYREGSQIQPSSSTIPLDQDYHPESGLIAQTGDEKYSHQSGILAPPTPGDREDSQSHQNVSTFPMDHDYRPEPGLIPRSGEEKSLPQSGIRVPPVSGDRENSPSEPSVSTFPIDNDYSPESGLIGRTGEEKPPLQSAIIAQPAALESRLQSIPPPGEEDLRPQPSISPLPKPQEFVADVKPEFGRPESVEGTPQSVPTIPLTPLPVPIDLEPQVGSQTWDMGEIKLPTTTIESVSAGVGSITEDIRAAQPTEGPEEEDEMERSLSRTKSVAAIKSSTRRSRSVSQPHELVQQELQELQTSPAGVKAKGKPPSEASGPGPAKATKGQPKRPKRVVIEGVRQSVDREGQAPEFHATYYNPAKTNKSKVKVGITVAKAPEKHKTTTQPQEEPPALEPEVPPSAEETEKPMSAIPSAALPEPESLQETRPQSPETVVVVAPKSRELRFVETPSSKVLQVRRPPSRRVIEGSRKPILSEKDAEKMHMTRYAPTDTAMPGVKIEIIVAKKPKPKPVERPESPKSKMLLDYLETYAKLEAEAKPDHIPSPELLEDGNVDVLQVLKKFGLPDQHKALESLLDHDTVDFDFGGLMRQYYSYVLRSYCLINMQDRYRGVSSRSKSFNSVDISKIGTRDEELDKSTRAKLRRLDDTREKLRKVSVDEDHFNYLKSLANNQATLLPLTLVHLMNEHMAPVIEDIFRFYGKNLGTEHKCTKVAGFHYVRMRKRVAMYNYICGGSTLNEDLTQFYKL